MDRPNADDFEGSQGEPRIAPKNRLIVMRSTKDWPTTLTRGMVLKVGKELEEILPQQGSEWTVDQSS